MYSSSSLASVSVKDVIGSVSDTSYRFMVTICPARSSRYKTAWSAASGPEIRSVLRTRSHSSGGTAWAYLGRHRGLSKTQVMVPTGAASLGSRRCFFRSCFLVNWPGGTCHQS